MGDPLCGLCNLQINTRARSIKCSGFCDQIFHASCYNIPSDVLKNVDKIPGLLWKCPSCIQSSEDMHKLLESKLSAVINQFQTMLTSLKYEFSEVVTKKLQEINASANTGNVKLYSAVTKNNPAIIVKPKDVEQKTVITKSDVLLNINPVKSNLSLSGIKNVKNGGILIGCDSAEDVSKFKQLASEKLGGKYEIKEVGNFYPRIRIAGMSENFSEDDIAKYIEYQNKDLISKSFQCKVIEVKPTRKRSDIFQTVVQIDAATYNNIMSIGKGKLFLGYDVCDVFDAIEIKRCFKCSGFSHYSKQCKCQRYYCPKCCENHPVKECKSSILKCINCVKYNEEKSTSHNINHAAWDSDCFSYLQKVNEFKSSLLFSK